MAIRGAVWIALFMGVSLAPLVFALIGAARPGQGFLTDFSVALGFVGLAMMGLEFVLVARFSVLAAPFGPDSLLQFHRHIGFLGLAFIMTHVILSADWSQLVALDLAQTPWRVRFGALAALALIALVVTSVWRVRLHLSYEAWHIAHSVLAIAFISAAVTHILLVNHYVDSPWKQALWLLMSAAFVALLLWVRIIKPLRLRRRPWRVESVVAEQGRATTLVLAPVGHGGFRFEPGQFAWFAFGKSPLALTQHPFSISSSAETTGTLAISIKALGDFSTRVQDIETGATVYVDGPHGVFTVDQHEGPGFCFIAGGIGVTPVMSMLFTLADRADVRPVILYYANQRWEDVTFRDEIERLQGRLNLRVIHALEEPPDGWLGETGFLTKEILLKHLPPNYRRFQFFVCGPKPMLDAMEQSLLDIGAPSERIHTERFGWI
ncbi:MAG TPA: ferredoxin reductase family protein [Patescibacteria group bacterium]|nr:ferredoxin reductase family protein [Patescibacteria group bacterium]